MAQLDLSQINDSVWENDFVVICYWGQGFMRLHIALKTSVVKHRCTQIKEEEHFATALLPNVFLWIHELVRSKLAFFWRLSPSDLMHFLILECSSQILLAQASKLVKRKPRKPQPSMFFWPCRWYGPHGLIVRQSGDIQTPRQSDNPARTCRLQPLVAIWGSAIVESLGVKSYVNSVWAVKIGGFDL